MSMSFDQLCTFVRAHADIDSADVTNDTLETYARIAYNDIHTRTNFPLLQVVYTLTTVAGQQDYAFTSIPSGDLDKVFAVVDTTTLGRRLIFMTKSDADLAYGAPVGMTSDVATAYTVENGVLSLYPKPSSTGKTYKVRGLRSPAAWPAGIGSIPDLPAVLHEAIAWYMLSSYFMSQEDLQLSGTYLREYEQMVDRFVRNESFKDFGARNNVMGGQNYVPTSFTRWVRGMLE